MKNYELYLEVLNKKLEGFFENQKPYIFCQKGCAKCCQNAEFPFSELEVKYLLEGFLSLPKEIQDVIEANIVKLINEKKAFGGEKFLYTCPFLIDNVCSLYKYRGIVCRTFGLIANRAEEKVKVPFCYQEGLNYSNVIDLETGKLSLQKLKELSAGVEPVGFNIGYEFLTGERVERAFNLHFGEKKPLIEWFLDV